MSGVLRALAQHEPVRAGDLASVIGLAAEDVYATLVQAEAAGVACQRVTHVRGSMPVVEWTLTPAYRWSD